MSRSFVAFMVGCVFLTGCGQVEIVPTAKQDVSTTGTDAFASNLAVEDFTIDSPIRFENLTIFPVTSRVPKTDDRFITLDEGLKAGTIEIREIGAALMTGVSNTAPVQTLTNQESVGEYAAVSALDPSHVDDDPIENLITGHSVVRNQQQGSMENAFAQTRFASGNDVNSLIVVNRSDKPLYLMPGEIIIGGSQDRTIGNELVIAPHSEPTQVPVYCVEHGRWGVKGTEETIRQITALELSSGTPSFSAASRAAGDDRALERLAEQADQGAFVASVGRISKKGLSAVQLNKDQSAVWDNVAATNGSSGVNPTSGAFTANYVDDNTIQRLEPYMQHLESPVANLDQVVGVLVAINGKIESIDVFESTPLFQKVWPKLLKSYALDAANAGHETASKNPECTLVTARMFFAEAMHADVASTVNEGGIAMTKRDGEHVISFTSHREPAAAAAAAPANMSVPAAMGGMGGAVHFSGLSK